MQSKTYKLMLSYRRRLLFVVGELDRERAAHAVTARALVAEEEACRALTLATAELKRSAERPLHGVARVRT